MEQPSAEVRLNSLFLLLRGRGALVVIEAVLRALGPVFRGMRD
jgi:hypothetical protein